MYKTWSLIKVVRPVKNMTLLLLLILNSKLEIKVKASKLKSPKNLRRKKKHSAARCLI
jgi:hypothetical protein